ncbi:hypothetical protein R6Q59_015031 [Mikania micrantha]
MNLTLLTRLTIVDCQSIDVASYPGGNWHPNLVSLDIGGLKKPISEWGSLNFPTSLVHLALRNEPHLRNFSQLSHLLPSSLRSLEIEGFDKLESLSVGLQHLTSLRHLLIGNCPKLKDLPEALLPSLFKLAIYGCPILTRRQLTNVITTNETLPQWYLKILPNERFWVQIPPVARKGSEGSQSARSGARETIGKDSTDPGRPGIPGPRKWGGGFRGVLTE